MGNKHCHLDHNKRPNRHLAIFNLEETRTHAWIRTTGINNSEDSNRDLDNKLKSTDMSWTLSEPSSGKWTATRPDNIPNDPSREIDNIEDNWNKNIHFLSPSFFSHSLFIGGEFDVKLWRIHREPDLYRTNNQPEENCNSRMSIRF